jgi:hypothetical protein
VLHLLLYFLNFHIIYLNYFCFKCTYTVGILFDQQIKQVKEEEEEEEEEEGKTVHSIC